MRIGVADYGLNVWYGGLFDVGDRLEQLAGIGYEGLERLAAISADDALVKAAEFRRRGMNFATVRGPDVQCAIRWAAALGCAYVWLEVTGRDFDTFCRQANEQARVCARWGLRAALHNHLGTLVETQEQLDEFMGRCPEVGLIFDTAHHAAAGGDCFHVVEHYVDRFVAVHVKDWLVTNAEIGLDQWPQRGRFCELGAGNLGLDNGAVVQAMIQAGYDGWLFVEHDTHLRDPLADLAHSRQVLREAGV